MNPETYTEYALLVHSQPNLSDSILAPRFESRAKAREHRKVMIERHKSYDPSYRVRVVKRQITITPWVAV